jgi:hypothetical protein
MTSRRRLMALLLMVSATGPVWAMSCARQPLPGRVADHEHIFVAQVTSARLVADKQAIEASFEVEEVLKGHPEQLQVIRSSFTDHNYATQGALIAMYQPDLAPGMHVLAFANGKGPVEFGACSATLRLQRYDDKILQDVRTLIKGS